MTSFDKENWVYVKQMGSQNKGSRERSQATNNMLTIFYPFSINIILHNIINLSVILLLYPKTLGKWMFSI